MDPEPAADAAKQEALRDYQRVLIQHKEADTKVNFLMS